MFFFFIQNTINLSELFDRSIKDTPICKKSKTDKSFIDHQHSFNLAVNFFSNDGLIRLSVLQNRLFEYI